MNFAEGKGPKQQKKPYVMGQFVTIYGNDGAPTGAANPPATPYTATQGPISSASGRTWSGGIVGSVVPGLNINVNGNGSTDVSFVVSPGSNESVQDLQNAGFTLNSDPFFVGSVTVTLQGSPNRMWDPDDYVSTLWTTIVGASGTISGGNAMLAVSPTGTPWPIYNAYRLVATGTAATGIVNWAIAGMFTDLSAMRVGFNSGDANGNIGQLSIQAPTNYTIVSGGYYYDNESVPSGTWEYAGTDVPFVPIKNNVDYIA